MEHVPNSMTDAPDAAPEASKPAVLIVEDDPIVAEGLMLALRAEGHDVVLAPTVAAADAVIASPRCSELGFCLLDVLLPDGSGIDLCERVRERTGAPILFLTACDDEVHTVLALEKGADDYIAKPFHIRELLARMKAVERRTGRVAGHPAANPAQGAESNRAPDANPAATPNANPDANPSQSLRQVVAGNTVDLGAGKVFRDGHEVCLTAVEYKLLMVFMQNRGRILARHQVLDILWDAAGDYVNDNTLTVYIRRLRGKIDDPEGRVLQTVRRIGYRLNPEVPSGVEGDPQ